MAYDSFCADIAKLYPLAGSLTEGAPPAPLGMKQRIPATATGFTHGYVVTATGVLAGSARFDSSVNYDATIHSSFGLGANEGEQLWILVGNTGGTIGRGTAVTFGAAADPYKVGAAGADPAVLVGVAQFDIPTNKAAYVLVKGVGKVKAGTGDITIDTPLQLVADGMTDAAAEDAVVAHSLSAATKVGVEPANLADAVILGTI
tara:strand:- start:651 stop:1259 length:609 start_codon:yes stop_codon:yes gene_type:complete